MLFDLRRPQEACAYLPKGSLVIVRELLPVAVSKYEHLRVLVLLVLLALLHLEL